MFYKFFLLLIPLSIFSQDSIFKNIDRSFEESIERQDKMFNFYTDDFLVWKNKVDLKKIILIPEKAVVNQYKEVISNRDKITSEINKYLGVPYLWGGDNPNAFDCSGLVQWTLKKSLDLSIPRTTNQQYNYWKKLISNQFQNLKEGDLVYFKTFGSNPVSHVGIFIGNNTFVHSPKKNDYVKASLISGYWKSKLVGFLDIDLIIY
jgi:hypothetical protein|tara:strand:- start:133 stop:747 length:615 start_codon:yes stop_codon:yes gene_type:complete